jgi:hypothetical protein
VCLSVCVCVCLSPKTSSLLYRSQSLTDLHQIWHQGRVPGATVTYCFWSKSEIVMVVKPEVEFIFSIISVHFQWKYMGSYRTAEPILTHDTSNDVFSDSGDPFWGPISNPKFVNPIFPKKPILGPHNVFPMGQSAECCEKTDGAIFASNTSNDASPRPLHGTKRKMAENPRKAPYFTPKTPNWLTMHFEWE